MRDMLNNERWKSTLAATGIAFVATFGLRQLGLLEPAERSVSDFFLRQRPPEIVDDRIVIVAATEADIQRYNWPLSDQHLAIALEAIYAQNPRVVGLDLYRDLQNPPGSDRLAAIFQTAPNLIGIELLPSSNNPAASTDIQGVSGPPMLQQRGLVGANNYPYDVDGAVRRGLLFLKPDGADAISESFVLKVALHYLNSEGIRLRPPIAGSRDVRLGKATIPRFSRNDGNYRDAPEFGYQFLANIRGFSSHRHTVSLGDVIEGKIPPNLFRDRIVLIGANTPSIKDFFLAPYLVSPNGQEMTQIAGVFLQADFISQLISAAIDGRPMMTSFSETAEILWIASLCLIGAIGAWRFRRPQAGVILVFAGSFGVFALGYGAITQAIIIPVFAPWLGFGMASLAIVVYRSYQSEELRKSTAFLNSIIDAIPDPVFVKTPDLKWVVLNEAYSQLVGHPRDDLLHKSEADVFAHDEAEAWHQEDERVLKNASPSEHEACITDVHGQCRIIATKRSLHRDGSGNLFLIGVLRDITERKHLESRLTQVAERLQQSNAELQQFANHDALTNLPNRKLFLETLEQSIQWADENQKSVGLMFLDLDGFKAVNDTFGHGIGDELLIAVARRLQGCLRGSDTIARLGGDEFTVVLPGLPNHEVAGYVAQKLVDALAQEFKIQGQSIYVTSSVGIGLYPEHALTLDMLIQVSDEAMFIAKHSGKNRYEFAINSPDRATAINEDERT